MLQHFPNHSHSYYTAKVMSSFYQPVHYASGLKGKEENTWSLLQVPNCIWTFSPFFSWLCWAFSKNQAFCMVNFSQWYSLKNEETTLDTLIKNRKKENYQLQGQLPEHPYPPFPASCIKQWLGSHLGKDWQDLGNAGRLLDETNASPRSLIEGQYVYNVSGY